MVELSVFLLRWWITAVGPFWSLFRMLWWDLVSHCPRGLALACGEYFGEWMSAGRWNGVVYSPSCEGGKGDVRPVSHGGVAEHVEFVGRWRWRCWAGVVDGRRGGLCLLGSG